MKPDPTFDAAADNAYRVTADELRQFIETFRCDYCETDHAEDDLTQYAPLKWACDACARANDEEAAAMQEMAEDDMAHAAMERMWEDG